MQRFCATFLPTKRHFCGFPVHHRLTPLISEAGHAPSQSCRQLFTSAPICYARPDCGSPKR